MLRGRRPPAASRPAGKGAQREAGREGLEVSPPPARRETRAGWVTALRPPCQPAGMETERAPGRSPAFASDSQVPAQLKQQSRACSLQAGSLEEEKRWLSQPNLVITKFTKQINQSTSPEVSKGVYEEWGRFLY
ncbi:hypothetical protein VULLAG_LOCUS15059 [Vulpes lagopus]